MSGRRLVNGALTAFALIAPPFIIFVHPTLEIVRRNTHYFPAGYGVGWPMYLAGLLLLLVGTALWSLRRFLVARVLLGVYLLSGVGWFAYTMARELLEPRWLLLLVLVTVLLIGAVLIRGRVEQTANSLGLAGAILVLGLASSFWLTDAGAENGNGQPGAGAGNGDAFGDEVSTEASELPNVYHLILDEFQTEMFEIHLTAETSEVLEGFVFFPEASTPYGRTRMALASMFAPRSYAYDQPLADYIGYAFTDERSLLGLLNGAGYKTTGWLHELRYLGGAETFDEIHLHRDVAEQSVLADQQATLVRSVWLYNNLPRTVSSQMIPDHHFDQLTVGALLPDDAPSLSVASFRQLLRFEPRLGDHGRYVLAHLILPHFPYVLDANCEIAAARGSAEQQAGCTMLLIEEFLTLLKELGRYDDSMIIIQADHGARFELRDGQLVNVEDVGYYSETWSRARSRPLLLVKPPDAAEQALATSPVPATLEDVLPTIADALGWEHEPKDGRASLLSDDFPERPLRPYHFYDTAGERVAAGDLHRFLITGDEIEFDRAVPVPSE